MTDSTQLTELEQELQDENEQLAQQLSQAQSEILTLRAKEQATSDLAAIIKDQQSEIMLLKQNNTNLTQQNEKLLELAKNEKLLHEQSEKLKIENAQLKRENDNLRQQAASLQKQLEKAMTIHLPDESLLQRFTTALKGADDKARDITLVHWINLAVVAVFVILAGVSMYMSHAASEAAKQAYNAVNNGIYDKDGWSMVPGAYLNEYTYANQRPEDYAQWKERNPDKAHY